MPHVKGGSAVTYNTGVRPAASDGLAVGRTDGSAQWVKWLKLNTVTNYDILRYEAR
jgi:F0F1-type ATP synthase alpha subunit